ncbi:hypothetical protein ACFLQI_00560 [Candidatus Undinarchaeota archaeon]
MKRYLLILLPIIALGCISGGDTAESATTCVPVDTSGVLIQNFQSDVPNILTGEDIVFLMQVENMGDAQATGVEAEITSLGGLNPKGGVSLVQNVGDLEEKVEGIEAPSVVDWELTSPSDLGTLEKETMSVKARLTYDYVSSGQADVVYVPNDEWRQRQKSGETVIDAGVQCSNAPVSVSVIPQNPLRANPEEDGAVSVRFTIRNEAGGIIKNVEGNLDVVDSIKVDLNSLTDDFEPTADCDFEFDDEDGARMLYAEDMKLINGQKTLSCKFRLMDAPIRETRFPLVANLEYRYVQEDEADVVVETIAGYTELNLGKDDAEELLNYTKTLNVEGQSDKVEFEFTARTYDGTIFDDVDGTNGTLWNVSGDSLVLIAHAAVNGESLMDTFDETAVWSASIRNQNTKSYPLTIDKIEEADCSDCTGTTGDIANDTYGPFEIYLDFADAPSGGNLYDLGEEATVTIGFSITGKSASGSITNFYLEE